MANNPYAIARKSLNLTQSQLAQHAHCTVQVVTNLEAFLYHKPPISIANLFPDIPLNLYTECVKQQRIENSHLFDYANTHALTFRAFRHSVTPSFRGFCRALVFQPSLLAEFERYHRNTRILSNALSEVGLTRDAVTRLLGPQRPETEVPLITKAIRSHSS